MQAGTNGGNVLLFMSLTLRAKRRLRRVKGIHGQGIALYVKDEGSNVEPVGRPEAAQRNSGRDILTQDGTGVEVFCERFDTEKNIHRLHRANLCNLWHCE